jgi:hypothetical protein
LSLSYTNYPLKVLNELQASFKTHVLYLRTARKSNLIQRSNHERMHSRQHITEYIERDLEIRVSSAYLFKIED